ncbi:MAG: TonB-dependent receptor [Flavobacteriales bacterium]|nr:TonB-dependent receptor [Flavobacteriales bacterium]|tara:strand:- start:3591 stop:5822 length:2232 start_codon:yes stop_codon:yes gene_type:complete
MKKYFLLISFLFFVVSSFSQTGTIRGFVSDKNTGESIMFCNVTIDGTSHGSQTDLNGMYTLSKIPVGEHKIAVTFIGYKKLTKDISLNKGQILTLKFELESSTVNIGEVEISAERQEMKTDVKAASIKITNEDLNLVPTIGGEADLAQYMQIIPGVIFTGDQGGQLYIRGGSPVQNKVLLDGMTIYSPFHSIGLFSVFDADIIKTTDVYTGGFSAEYGGRVSSIMDIKTKDGNKKRLQGKLSSNTFGSKLLVEGPLKKGGGTTFLFSGKTSYLDKTSESLYNFAMPYSYTDLYGKITFNANNGSKANVYGFNFQDQVNYQGISDLQWSSNGLGSEFILIPGNSPVLIEGNFAYSKYYISLDENASALRESSISGGSMGFDFTSFQPKGKIKYGFDVYGFETKYKTYNSANAKIELNENNSEFSAYVNYQYNADRFILEPGLRLQKYTLGTSPEPRLGIKYLASDVLRLKLATGLYSQNIISTVSDRDVVNLFYGFISSPENLPTDEDGNEYKNQIQKARHIILGAEYDINLKMDFQIEGYIKDFNQITNINRSMTSNYDNEFIVESGLARGVDFLLKYKTKKLYLWSVYSLGFIKRYEEENEYFPHFDRRHNINLVSSFRFGKKDSWKADARWNLGSGFPFTQTQGFYENIPFSDGINTDYTIENGELEIVYAELNKGRLSYYHRLDLSLSKTIEISKNTILEITASVTNAYNRNNIFYINRITDERIYQLPLLPSGGISLKF